MKLTVAEHHPCSCGRAEQVEHLEAMVVTLIRAKQAADEELRRLRRQRQHRVAASGLRVIPGGA